MDGVAGARSPALRETADRLALARHGLDVEAVAVAEHLLVQVHVVAVLALRFGLLSRGELHWIQESGVVQSSLLYNRPGIDEGILGDQGSGLHLLHDVLVLLVLHFLLRVAFVLQVLLLLENRLRREQYQVQDVVEGLLEEEVEGEADDVGEEEDGEGDED